MNKAGAGLSASRKEKTAPLSMKRRPRVLGYALSKKSPAAAFGAAEQAAGGCGPSRSPISKLRGVEEFEILLINRHVLAEGDRRGLCAADEVHPAPRLARRLGLLDDRLVMLERVHF